MSQVSYGTITITDTTDIHTYIRYAKQVPLLSVSDFQSIPNEDTRYIAVYSGILTECPAWDSNVWDNLWVDFVGTDGVSVLGVKEIYFLKRTSDPIPTTPRDNVNITDTTGNPGRWTTVIPQYIEGAQYYSCIQTDLSDGTYVHSVAAINQNLIESSEAAVAVRATQQHFWFNAEDIVDEDEVTVLTESGAYITDTPIDDFKENKTGGYLLARSDGLVLGKDSNKDAILNSDGLITKSGGIIAGESGSNGYIYLSTHDYPLKDISDPDNPINGLTINNHTPTAEGTDGKVTNDPAWREVIGTKFGVDSEGNLYAAGAHIDGDIIAQSLTIGSGANAYDGMAAINISGYSIEIVIENIEEDDDHVYLYPHLYHNGIEERVSDYTRFLWYENNNEIAIIGDETNYGRILASRSNSYRVTYEFDDGEVGSGTPIETIKVEPTEYITNIDNIGIKVHPKQWSTNSNYLQIDGNGVYIKDSNDIGLAEFTAANAQIGKSGTTHFVINADSLQAFNELGNKYFEVTANGLTWGSNTAATTTQVNNAALTASNYITDLTDGGIRIHPINNENNSVVIDSNGMEIFKDGIDAAHSVAKYGDTVRIGKGDESHIEMDYHSLQLKDAEQLTYFWVSDLRDAEGYFTDTFTGDGSQTSFEVRSSVERDTDNSSYLISFVKINDVVTTDYTYEYLTNQVKFNTAPTSGSVITVRYKPSFYKEYKAYTFGIRKDGAVVGNLSVAEGNTVTASGLASHAEGNETLATGANSHAEGRFTSATKAQSHVEGYYSESAGLASHAEGFSTSAKGQYSHAEGEATKAEGRGSHSQGCMTWAQGAYQTAIGRYNVKQGSPTGTPSTTDNAFIVGNGSAVDNRKNALELTWAGNLRIAGRLTQSSDRRLKEHISYLDKDADEFIRQLKPAHYIKDDEHHVGFYAQDVDEADKWDCMTGEMNGYMTLGYMELIAPLVTYCQHLEKRINELQNKMKEDSNGEKSS